MNLTIADAHELPQEVADCMLADVRDQRYPAFNQEQDLRVPLRANPPSTESRKRAAAMSRASAALIAGFQTCVDEGLRLDAAMQGSVVVELKADQDGRVTMANAVDVNGLTPDVIACMMKSASGRELGPPRSLARMPLAVRGGKIGTQ
jgi:hypothetical protein